MKQVKAPPASKKQQMILDFGLPGKSSIYNRPLGKKLKQ